jgi:3-oxoadipate enol-lactonase
MAPGPSPDAPTVLLLHGWTATSDLNWYLTYAALAERYNVLALDHRGHGRGIRSTAGFSLEDCADDAAALVDALHLERVIPIGYSMGGAIAQLFWQRHARLTAGLVLCSTAPYFAGSRQEKVGFIGLTGLAALARATPAKARTWLTEQIYLQRKTENWDPWAIDEVSQNDWTSVLEAGIALGQFDSREWLAHVDVPTSVVITMQDEVVATRRQIRLFEGIRDAEAFRVDGGHDACVAKPQLFALALLRACKSVLDRVDE